MMLDGYLASRMFPRLAASSNSDLGTFIIVDRRSEIDDPDDKGDDYVDLI